MKEIIKNILIVITLIIVMLLVLKFANNKQVKKDCLNAQRHLINYNMPIPENLNSLCVELKYYE
jgi:regulatory protein YycI of two-component signal transduction system YycFG